MVVDVVKTFVIEGKRIHDIPSFYEEINRVFMANEDWKLGMSLDALDDMFYGGYGKINNKEEVEIIWRDFEKNRKDLGFELTLAYYREKLKSPSIFSTSFVEEKLDELNRGVGKTYFEIILEIISEHPNIKLIPE